MSIQKFHREAYDIVLSNYPEGEIRERETRRFEHAATAPSARATCSSCDAAPAILPMLRPLVLPGAPIETGPGDDMAAAVLASGARVELAARQERRLGLRRPRQARRGGQEPRLARPGSGARERGRLRARRRARRQMSRKPAAERPEQEQLTLGLLPAAEARRNPRRSRATRDAVPSTTTSATTSTPTSRRAATRRRRDAGAGAAADLRRQRAAEGGAADAGEPVHGRAGGGRGVGAQALGQRAPLLLRSRTRRRSSTACCSRARRSG